MHRHHGLRLDALRGQRVQHAVGDKCLEMFLIKMLQLTTAA